MVVGTWTMTSLLPSRSTATTSCMPQLENHRRPSCQRGDSPNPIPVNKICTAGSEDLITTSSENQFVVPPLGGRVWRHGMDLHPTLPPKGDTTKCDFHSFRASAPTT